MIPRIGAAGVHAAGARPAELARAGLMLAGLGLALVLRLDVNAGLGHVGAGYRPVAAGLVFALALLALAWAAARNPAAARVPRGYVVGSRWGGPPRTDGPYASAAPPEDGVWSAASTRVVIASSAALAWGLFGAAVLAAFPLAFRLSGSLDGIAFPAGQFPLWAAVVTLVAVAEEILLRGVLFAAVVEALGTPAAIAVTAIAFALLHVPLYGPGVLVLDLAVGIWLGALRVVSGGVTAPAAAHALADLAAWWLV